MSRFILRMKDMTARSDKDLCPSCTNVYERTDTTGTTRECTAAGRAAGLVRGRVTDCTDYYPKNIPSLRSFSAIAWEITTNQKTGRVGFITPSDRRKRDQADARVEAEFD